MTMKNNILNTSSSSWRNYCCRLLMMVCLLLLNSIVVVKGVASDDLLGGQYSPTTNVNYIVDLTELVDAIAIENNITDGQARYQQKPPDSTVSLESLGAAKSKSLHLNTKTNPLYSLYMYAYWRSPNGSYDKETTDEHALQLRNEMKFLDQPVDYYGHTIIYNEFKKVSGYDPKLTADTIRVTNLWMFTVQSLYDGVSMCAGMAHPAAAGKEVDVTDPLFVNPIDMAAAFWFGGLDSGSGVTLDESQTLYAWAEDIKQKFTHDISNPLDVNEEMIKGLKVLQSLLGECLNPSKDGTTVDNNKGDDDDKALKMRLLVDDLVRYMTVPLVQNLIHHAGDVVQSGGNDPDKTDYMILYGLVALPLIRICDESAFDELYKALVYPNPKSIDNVALKNVLLTLYNHLDCLGITCEQIGTKPMWSGGGGDWPTCQDTVIDYQGYVPANKDQFLQTMKIDLDVRTIGTLIQMDAEDAALDIYQYGRFVKDVTSTTSTTAGNYNYYSLKSYSLDVYNAKNIVGLNYNNYIDTVNEDLKADTMAMGEFDEATLKQRRIISESSLVLITLHAYAVNSMYEALDACNDPASSSTVPAQMLWDKAVSSLVGWGEATSSNQGKGGFLFMEMAQYLCQASGTCNVDTGLAEVNQKIIDTLKAGKVGLVNSECSTVVEGSILEIEKFLQTILIDITAYFAERIAEDKSAGNLAEGYGVAMALIPLVRDVNNVAATTLESNMGTFGGANPFMDGRDTVMNALRTLAGDINIDCTLVTQDVCGEITSSPGTGVTMPTMSSGTGGEASTSSTVASLPYTGKYVPTTNVDYISSLTDILYDISIESDILAGESLYKKPTESGISLADVGGGDNIWFDARTNPLYSIYMYALWRSGNGSGHESTDQTRDEMKFLDQPVDDYAHTIINDEFGKKSGYDPLLTADTIRVNNLWMGTVQALYDAVQLCDEADDPDTDPSIPGFESPIDQAAAFWYGNLDAANSDYSDASLYTWAKNIKEKFLFEGSPNPFDVNTEMSNGLKILQKMLNKCLDAPENSEDDALKMRQLVDDLTKYMTVPLVQNLIHHSGDAALALESDPDKTDYMVLYGLVTLPTIRICDEYVYNDLYKKFVPDAKQMNTTILYDALNSIYGRLICMGISCDYVGEASVLANSGRGWPTCQDPSVDFRGYKGTNPKQFLEEMKVDLDIRTIGTLIEMDARPAAYDVYHWGRHVKDASGNYYSIQTKSTEAYHVKNSVGNGYNSYFAELAVTTSFADEHEYKDMMALGEFADATPTQRRIIAESSMVLITMHAFAMNCLYIAIDYCRDGSSSIDAELHWDRAFASIVGWGEETVDADGFLFMEIARYLCEEAGTCNEVSGDSEINRQLIVAMESGKSSLEINDCDAAEAKIPEVEKLLKTILIDITAYFAERISEDTTDGDNLAEGYGVAVALVPLVQDVNTYAAEDVESNMGVFGSDQTPFLEGKLVVMNALKSLASDSNIDCALLTQDLCDGTATSPGTEVTTPDIEDEDMPSYDRPGSCQSGIDGGVPSKDGSTSSPLLGGAYTPTSNVDHIVGLTDLVQLISDSSDVSNGLDYYTRMNDGVSLQCLSTGSKWLHIIQENPLYVIYMYGLWVSDDGDNSGDGYSSKTFDDGEILNYGDTIIMDELDKSSGFDSQLSAETIRVMNMWMAMTTEMYRAADSCRGGYVSEAPQGFNPVDFAAAFWYGSAQNPDLTDNSSLYAWAKRAEQEFVEQSMGVNDAITTRLNDLQKSFQDCKFLSKDEQEKLGIQMKHKVDDITRWMVVPIVQNFIHHLASKSGMGEEYDDERNYMVLYALSVLPFISICDEDTFDDLYSDLITDLDSYDSGTFISHMKLIQDRFACLGITCDMVGKSMYANEGWPECKVPSAANTKIAGYTPTSELSLEMAKIDLDISTILSFIVMEASDAAFDIYTNGRNARLYKFSNREFEYMSLQNIGIPESHPDSIMMYKRFSSDYGRDYTTVTKNAITGEEEFFWSSVLKNSAAASLSIATIDMHLSILDNMYQAVECDGEGKPIDGWDLHWDNAVASAVGWAEGSEDGGSSIDGYLFFQLAEELCEHFGSCDPNGESVVNQKLMAEFNYGQDKLKENDCAGAKLAKDAIEKYLQAILVDNLAYHARFADSNRDDRHCLMAHVSKNALVPLVRPIDTDAADKIEANVDANSNKCRVDDVEAVYQALNTFVVKSDIDCSWLGSSVCDGTSTTIDFENDSEYTENLDDPNTPGDETYSMLNDEYNPLANVEILHQSVKVRDICNAADRDTAKDLYSNDETAGISIKSMSTSAKYAMAEELQFNQYVYALQDNVDKTAGSLLFDGKPATEYANTITSDALDTSTSLGCRSVKVLNIWMWIVHKLNDSIEACKGNFEGKYGLLDEAAALWEGGLLHDMAENLGPTFGHSQIDGMTFLNRQIVDRFNKAKGIISSSQNECDYTQAHDLRIIVKETISYMTAVLVQGLIGSMLDDLDPKKKEEMVELMAFATLPHIKSCGHEATYDELYNNLVGSGYTDDMMEHTVTVLQSHLNCLGLTCADLGRHTKATDKYPPCNDNLDIAGYVPVNATRTNMVAKLDLDTVAIHQLLSMDKYGVAKRIYQEGHNYYDYDNKEDYNFVSLHNLTQSNTINSTQFPIYSLYNDYLGSDYADNLITQAFDRTGLFEKTTATQRDLAVNVGISSFISYMAGLEALYFSSARCNNDVTSAESAFDGAVALLVGSVEGPGRGGSRFQEGRMFFNIAKRTCEHFHSCRANDAESNVELFRALEEGQEFIKAGKCEDLAKAVEAINSLLKVPLIQSLIYFSDSTISEISDNDAAGHVATMAVLPILNDIDEFSADSIKSAMSFAVASPISSDEKEDVVYDSLSDVFANPKTEGILDCDLVTKIEQICYPPLPDNPDTPEDESESNVINQEQPMPISNGLYISNNYVGDRSSIALDIKEIEERLNANDADEAKHYYTKGLNSKIYNENGIPTGELRSISRFSTESGTTMRSDPTYNLFVYGLSDQKQEFLGRPATLYADSFISDLLYKAGNGGGGSEASEAMVAITIWMQVAHSLHSAYGACKRSFITDGRSSDGRDLQSTDPSLMIDEAAAYWIGDNQATGSSTEGHLLYALTEFIGNKFERNAIESESNINTRIMDLFNKARNTIAISKGCSTSEDTHLQLKGIVDEVIPLMAVPLLRNLLYYIRVDDPVLVKVYAVAVLPLFSACAPSTYNELKDELIDHDVMEMNKSYIYSKIQSMYSCLGLSCKTVGYMEDDDILRCEDSTDSKSLAGYTFVTEPMFVNKASHMDVDMRKIEIFINNGIYHFTENSDLLFGTAFDLYKYGEHSADTKINSLSSMARNTNRDVVPAFESFERYFNNDDNYADTIIVDAFKKSGVFEQATVDERKRVISFTLKYMVTYMAILEKLHSAAISCKQNKRIEGGVHLDSAAGYFVGSLEGKEDGGSFDGQLIFMLAKRMCVHFGTCSSSNHAQVNERIVNLLYAAQGEIETGACASMYRTISEIENTLIIPLIQATLVSALENEYYFDQEVAEAAEFYPEGYVLAKSILPIIHAADQGAAKDIESVMVDGFPGPDHYKASDYAKVFRAVQTALSKMDAVDCKEIGRLGGKGFCPGDVTSYEGMSPASRSSVSMVILGVMSCVLLYVL